ncbi:Conserved DNA-binding protein YbaB [Micromonospora pattaloongensis]|uniref:Conserved DNA-binding protein YbaB n=1 Tax=Micromonospora pattaloongensis TaxID=405436 RepID=A0A1H3SFT5_9ACTN|nr:YbaB/EbfC family nucleoid-associated protein [Micromonospora pattaloongensis]SDZ36607.1 Conserved DNA-binding protein YbaB [Micromonospora pattaloongensis]
MSELRDLSDLADYAHRQIERIQRMQQDIAAEYGEGRSPRGLVRARTGPGGALLQLRIDPAGLRLTADELEAEVTAAVTAAQQQFAARADEIMAPVLGLRPSEQAVNELEAGMNRLDALGDDLERLARRRGLAD